MSEKTIDLKPTYSFLFWRYLIGILLVPFFGIGLIVIYLAYRKQFAITYVIGNHSITITDRNYSEKVDLSDILDVMVKQQWIDKKLSTGKIIIITELKTVELEGVKNPQTFSELIMQAVEAEKIRLQKMNEILTPHSEEAPVSLDRLDYLTGLWQQGLLSDDDFKKEKKHFES